MKAKTLEEVKALARAAARSVQDYVTREFTLYGPSPVYYLSSMCDETSYGISGESECIKKYVAPLLSQFVFTLSENIDEIMESFGFRDVTPHDFTRREIRKSFAEYLEKFDDWIYARLKEREILRDETGATAFNVVTEKILSPLIDYYWMVAWLGVYEHSGYIVVLKLYCSYDDVRVTFKVL